MPHVPTDPWTQHGVAATRRAKAGDGVDEILGFLVGEGVPAGEAVGLARRAIRNRAVSRRRSGLTTIGAGALLMISGSSRLWIALGVETRDPTLPNWNAAILGGVVLLGLGAGVWGAMEVSRADRALEALNRSPTDAR